MQGVHRRVVLQLTQRAAGMAVDDEQQLVGGPQVTQVSKDTQLALRTCTAQW